MARPADLHVQRPVAVVPYFSPRLLCRGTDLEVPFQCPLDYLLPVDQLEQAPNLPYRLPGFLDMPQVLYLAGGMNLLAQRWALSSRY